MAAFRIASYIAPDPTPKRKERIRNEQMHIDLVPLPPIEILNEIFFLDPSVPEGLRWRDRPRDHFRHDLGHRFFSAKWPGQPAGSFCKKYYRVSLTYLANEDWVSEQFHNHRIIWAMHNGRDPGSNLIDHADIDCRNNDGGNLRLADGTQNSQNRRRRRDNRTGVAGVSFRSDIGKWRVRITVAKKVIDLGYFDTIEEAASVRKSAEIEHFGSFAPSEVA